MSTQHTASGAAAGSATDAFPPLPLEEWEDTKNTLHRFAQIVGKVRLACMPAMNHWWHVPLYVSTRGLTTGPMPHRATTFSIDFDFTDHALVLATSAGEKDSFALEGLSVARFYEETFSRLSRLGINVSILAKPYELSPDAPFPEDTEHASYDTEYVDRYRRVLLEVDGALKEFSGRFTGKASPVHLYWHSFDLAYTRFSGRRAPDREGADPVTRKAYSHEVISFGFWPGDDKVRAPAFYSYTAPEPPGLADRPLKPEAAAWGDANGSSMALLMYEDLRKMKSPRTVLLDFLESVYHAGAATAGWAVEELATVTFKD